MGVEQNITTEAYCISRAGECAEETVCSCHRLDGSEMIINNSSLASSSSSSTATATPSSSSSSFFRRGSRESAMLITLTILLSYLTCCVSAWPMLNQNHRRSFNYAPQQQSVVLPSDYDMDLNPWAMAAQPGGAAAAAGLADAYYDLPNLPMQQQDMYEDQLYEDPEDTYQMPYFGPIVDTEPEEELELEELKHEQPYTYEKRRSGKVMNTKKPAMTTTPATTAATPIAKTSSATTASASASALATQQAAAVNRGQKEIAMLRPPSPKPPHFPGEQHQQQQQLVATEPKITVAQRSLSNEKPSAYDRLRKYLSLDDALKKEYQQRRASAVSRHTKRESGSAIITDSDNLTGQLNSLKKRMN